MEAGFWMVLVSVAMSSRLVPFLLLSSGHGRHGLGAVKQHRAWSQTTWLLFVCLALAMTAVLVWKNSGVGGQVCDPPETP